MRRSPGGDRGFWGARVWIGCWGWVPIRLRYKRAVMATVPCSVEFTNGKGSGVRLVVERRPKPTPLGFLSLQDLK